jgi:hypothetical protein
LKNFASYHHIPSFIIFHTIMQFLQTLLFSAALVSAAPTSLSARDYSVSRMSNEDVFKIYHTCWGGKLVWPQNDMPPPVTEQVSSQLSLYKQPAAKAGTLTVHNYCDYDIHYQHLGNGLSGATQVLSAGTTSDYPLTGTVFKASKTASLAKVVQIEYSVAGNVLYYDMSLIDCLAFKDGLRTKDASGCVGLESGLQLGNQGFSFQCAKGAWCDDQAYFYEVSRDSCLFVCVICD